MKKVAIFTGSGSDFYFKIENLIKSLKRFKSFYKSDLFILDVGLKNEEKQKLSKYAKKIITPADNFKFNFVIKNKWSRLYSSRPFIKDYAPGYETYIWIDSDIIIQKYQALIDLEIITRNGKLGIVAESDNCYISNSVLNNDMNDGYEKIYKNLYIRRGWTYKNLRKYFNEKIAENYSSLPCLNAGFFALPHNSNYWKLWRELYQEVLLKFNDEKSVSMDQTTLNLAIYSNIKSTTILDSKYNFLVKRAMPSLNKKNLYCKPNFPHEPVYCLHFSGIDMKKMYKLKNYNNKEVQTSFILK